MVKYFTRVIKYVKEFTVYPTSYEKAFEGLN